MSHKLAKLIKRQHQASKSASSKYLGRRLGDRPLLPSSIANVTTGTFAVLMLAALVPVFLSSGAQAKSYSMTVTIDHDIVDLSVSPSEAGTFAKSSNSTVSVSTTNASGYTLSIASSGRNDGRLVNSNDDGSNNDGTNGNNYLPSITEQDGITEEQYKTLPSDGSTSPYNNTWAYLPSMWDGQANTLFRPSPTKAGHVLDHTTTANPEANKYTLAIGARVDTTQRIGSYSNTYVVLATANGTPYTITYKDDTITNFPTDESATAASDEVTISSNTPTKPGYVFLGWCDKIPTATATNNVATDTCSGTQYTSGDTWKLDQTASTNNLTLYAMWQELTMQTFTNSMCSAQASDHDVTLKDIRDGKTYTVRYINGNCWMTQNLAIEPGTHMTASDTNITSAQYNNTGYYSLPGEGYDVKTDFVSGESGQIPENCYADYYGNKYNGDGWDNACTHLPDIVDTSNTGYTSIQLGAWYNYAAATAGTIIGKSDNSAKDVYNLCPKNWTLPNYGQLSKIIAYDSEFSPVLNGAYGARNHISPGAKGFWWSSEAADDNSRLRYGLYAADDGLYIDYGIRYHAFSIRCLLK